MFNYEKSGRYFAQAAHGLEYLGAEELKKLGAREIKPTYRGMYFDADRAALYRANYRSRLCTRILAPLLRFDCHSAKYLYKTALKIEWHRLMTVDDTFAITATVADSRITHSQYAALRLKDAIADYFRTRDGERPWVDRDEPDIRIHLRVERNRATISADTSGGSLHRRGYRRETVEAPMQETVAAAVIELSEWEGERPLVDPMCGSGTLLVEAMMRYCRIPAGHLRRRFGFEKMPDFDPATWKIVREESLDRIREMPEGLVSGSDSSPKATSAAGTNLSLLPQGDRVAVTTRRYQSLDGIRDSLIVCNPPYGIRLERRTDMTVFMKQFGSFLGRKCSGSTACLYFGDPALIRHLGLKPEGEKRLASGGLEGVLVRYAL